MGLANQETDISALSLLQLSNAYLTGELSPVEVTRHMLARIGRLNPAINAVYHVDEAYALRQAEASERRYREGKSLSLLDGMPTTVKDALPVQGMPSYRGAASTPDDGLRYDWNAPAVDRLLEGGAVIMGKNTMCDFGIIASGLSSRHGITRNPWNLAHTPGASSSGAAASVAAGFSPATLGTDIVGSIRLPASYCGLVGLKPSYGRVPYYFPNNPALVAGPMARCVHDVAVMMDIISRPDRRDFTALAPAAPGFLAHIDKVPLRPRIRLISSLGFGVGLDAEVWAVVRQVAGLLQAHGAVVESPDVPAFDPDALAMAENYYRTRTFAELNQAPPERQRKAALIYEWTRPAERGTAEAMMLAMQGMQALREAAMRLMDGFDFLVMPSTPTPAFAAEHCAPEGYGLFDAWCNNFLFNLTEQPAISLNGGFSSAGLPIGVQVVGHRFNDLGVLQMARLIELLQKRPAGPGPWAESWGNGAGV